MTSTDRFSTRAQNLDIPIKQKAKESPPDRFSQRFNQINSPENSFNASQDQDVEDNKALLSFGAHALGQIPALPGNIRDLAYETGEQAKQLRRFVFDKMGMSFDIDEIEKYEKGVKESEQSISAPFKFLADKLPNSADVNKFIDEWDKGQLKPEGERQEFANQIGEDIVNSFLNTGPKNLYRNFLVPGLSNVVQKGMELYGADPKTSQIGKFLTWIGLDLAGMSNPRQMVGNQIRRTRSSIPANETLPVSPRDMRFLDLTEQRLRSGGTSPSKTAALTKIEEYRNAIQNGRIPARVDHDFYRTMNELKTNFGAFNVEGAARPAHVFNINRIQNLSRNRLNRYGRNQNPEFLRDFREANAAWAALEQSDAIAGYVKKNYSKPFVSEGAKVLFSKSYGIPVAVGLTALERTQAVLQRLRNPTLRRYYGNILQASLRDNTPMMINNMSKLDHELDKEEH